MSHVLQGRGQAGVGAGAGRAAGPGAATQPGELEGSLEDAWGSTLLFWETRFLPVENLKKKRGKHGGSRGEAGGKLGEARYFLGKHAFWCVKFLEKLGEAIAPSTLFIILKGVMEDLGDTRVGPGRSPLDSSRDLPALVGSEGAGNRLFNNFTTPLHPQDAFLHGFQKFG